MTYSMSVNADLLLKNNLLNRALIEKPILSALLDAKLAALKANAQCGFMTEAQLQICASAAEKIRNRIDSNTTKISTLILTFEQIDAALNALFLEDKNSLVREDQLSINYTASDLYATAASLVVHRMASRLHEAVCRVSESMDANARKYDGCITPLRKHMKDTGHATTWDKVFSSYASSFKRVACGLDRFLVRPVSCFLGQDPLLVENRIGKVALDTLSSLSGFPCVPPQNYLDEVALSFEIVELSAYAEEAALSLWRMSRDLRVFCSGPRAGLMQLSLPALAPGSSIMPGKVNPVILEMAMASADLVGSNHIGITMGFKNGWLEYGSESTMPLRLLVTSIEMLSTTMVNVVEKCLDGIEVCVERSRELAQ